MVDGAAGRAGMRGAGNGDVVDRPFDAGQGLQVAGIYCAADGDPPTTRCARPAQERLGRDRADAVCHRLPVVRWPMRLWRWISGRIHGLSMAPADRGPVVGLVPKPGPCPSPPMCPSPGPKRTATPARSVTAFPGAGRGRAAFCSVIRKAARPVWQAGAGMRPLTGFGVMWSLWPRRVRSRHD